MIWFLIKGMLRDLHRSLLPFIVVTFGVMLTTVVYSFINGELNDLVNSNARFETGHLKVITRAYKEAANPFANELALTDVDTLLRRLRKNFTGYSWTPRIKFAGLLDLPDKNGETKSQYSVFGTACDLLNSKSGERERLNLKNSLVRGRLPENHLEILLGEALSRKIGTGTGDRITLLSTETGGSITVQNFTVCGTPNFGIAALDRGAIIADISDLRPALNMPGSATEILGFSKNNFYNPDEAEFARDSFNGTYANKSDRFSPVMLTLGDQNGLGEYLAYVNTIGLLIVGIFLAAMSVVLLNTGLMSGIRRYGEVGLRLALGEARGAIYKSILYESIATGLAGSILGTSMGLGISLYLQDYGIDISETLRNSSIMMPNIIQARIDITSFYIGFIPGLLATVIGTAFSGIQIYRRQTASLFKELET